MKRSIAEGIALSIASSEAGYFGKYYDCLDWMHSSPDNLRAVFEHVEFLVKICEIEWFEASIRDLEIRWEYAKIGKPLVRASIQLLNNKENP